MASLNLQSSPSTLLLTVYIQLLCHLNATEFKSVTNQLLADFIFFFKTIALNSSKVNSLGFI